MDDRFARTQMLFGADAMVQLSNSRIAVFGVGGVGGYVVEALARSGVGALDLIDGDTVELSNLNRQIIATTSVLSQPKVEVAKRRVLDINPACDVRAINCFYLPKNAHEFDFASYDYVVDAVDTVAAKLSIIQNCQLAHTPIISSMGMGNKIDPTHIVVSTIYETSVDGLARVMRKECRRRAMDNFKVVYSTEPAREPLRELFDESSDAKPPTKEIDTTATNKRRSTPASCAFVPSVGGLIIASVVVRDLLGL